MTNILNNENKQKFKFNLKNSKSIEIIIFILIVIGLIVILFSSFFQGNTNKNAATFSTSNYIKETERKLSQILSNVNGAGKVNVMINVDSGLETVTAMETKEVTVGGETTITKTPILVNGKPIVLKEVYPKITGVLLVAEGANSIKVKLELLKATSSVLNIDEKLIEIYTMK